MYDIIVTILEILMAGWILVGGIVGLAYTMGGPRLTNARSSWRY